MEQKINITIPPEIAKGHYANLAIITHSADEFVLDFAQNLPGMQQAEVRSRVVMTPGHAKRLLAALSDNIEKYEKSFGAISGGTPGATYVVPAGGFKA